MKNKIIKWILVILWMGVIFYFSSRDYIESTNQSQGIINKTIIVEIYEKANNVNEETALENVDRITRKVAHGIEYLILAILICSLLYEYNLSMKKIIIISFIVCFLYSCTDELHQLFILGRSGEIRDVIIDNIGTLLGCFSYLLFRRRKV
jgi:VanZ family protein